MKLSWSDIPKYGIVMPLYLVYKLIPVFIIVGIPIFISGILIALIGTLGHIFFMVLFGIAVLFYFRHAYSIFNGKQKDKKDKNKKTRKPKNELLARSIFSQRQTYR